MKHHTFLSSKSCAGTVICYFSLFVIDINYQFITVVGFIMGYIIFIKKTKYIFYLQPEWMAPEVLRNEPANEKSV